MLQDPECLFCKIAAGKIPCKKVYENEEILAFEDIKPQAPVHILIIPKEHISTVAEIPTVKNALIGHLVSVTGILAREKGLENGYRLVFNCKQDAGQEVFHVHLHMLGGRKFNWPPG